MVENTYKYYNKIENLCLNCTNYHISQNDKVICLQTKKRPDYKYFCENFRPNKNGRYASKNIFNYSKIQESVEMKSSTLMIEFAKQVFKQALIYFLLGVLVPGIYLFFTATYISIVFAWISMVFIFPSIFISLVSIYTNKKASFYRLFLPNFFAGKNVHLPYYYMILSLFAYENKKEKSNDDLNIIEQSLIRVFGLKYVKFAKDFLTKGYEQEIGDKNFRKYLLRIEYKFRLLLFRLVSEMYVFDNLDDFKESKIIKETANILDIKLYDYDSIRKELEQDELEHQKIKEQQRLEAEEEKRRREEYRKRTYQIYNVRRKDYYRVMGLTSSATDDEIKDRIRELALKYHPDRFVGDENIEKQKAALEEFKEITEAYNIIRRKRGL